MPEAITGKSYIIYQQLFYSLTRYINKFSCFLYKSNQNQVPSFKFSGLQLFEPKSLSNLTKA